MKPDQPDGHDTFHGMGIIACCYNSICKLCNSVPRINVTADQLINAGKIDIQFYKPPLELSSLRFNDLKKTKFVDKTRNLETLLKITWPDGVVAACNDAHPMKRIMTIKGIQIVINIIS
jgi:hypothetical protein